MDYYLWNRDVRTLTCPPNRSFGLRLLISQMNLPPMANIYNFSRYMYVLPEQSVRELFSFVSSIIGPKIESCIKLFALSVVSWLASESSLLLDQSTIHVPSFESYSVLVISGKITANETSQLAPAYIQYRIFGWPLWNIDDHFDIVHEFLGPAFR